MEDACDFSGIEPALGPNTIRGQACIPRRLGTSFAGLDGTGGMALSFGADGRRVARERTNTALAETLHSARYRSPRRLRRVAWGRLPAPPRGTVRGSSRRGEQAVARRKQVIVIRGEPKRMSRSSGGTRC